MIAAATYVAATTGAMALVGHRMAHVIERKNQAEADLRYVVGHVREVAADRSFPLDAGAAACVTRAAGAFVALQGAFNRTIRDSPNG